MIEQKKSSHTKIDSIGEFTLINHLTKNFSSKQNSTIVGIGDDAAVLNFNGNAVVTTGMLIEGVHFDLSYMPLKHLLSLLDQHHLYY